MTDTGAPTLATVLRNQFELTWALAEVHLGPLTDDDLLRAPAANHWTVRRDGDGTWRPDWDLDEDGREPDPVPALTGAWVSWHLGWWWTTARDHLRGLEPPRREDVTWPGAATETVIWLRGLADDWRTLLTDLGNDPDALAAPAPYPWPPGSDRTVADTLAWANAELMKNVAELGQLRMLRHADAPPQSD
ncbi:DinB superfamily protein [Streptomyces sp. YIM 130001]|uniref:DinB family protein n=1 Tax=Streptomyces sp. YIM 130001 TaxID=2259644 RepID=UPI000E6575B2|nr:DinB family protein [Streptomyces sp. YIM 130001]RII09219.1 DinB superfamily protein [Streptomyces sp. YIM 130001]